jgi:inosine kinase
MKFPGKRKTKHYFPVSEDSRIPLERDLVARNRVYTVGIDQLIVDIEAHVDEEYLATYGLIKGESQIADSNLVKRITENCR